MIDEYGDGLIFILSQPRSGSTMLQRMLAAHPDIYTTQEPWIALYPLFSLKKPISNERFNANGERIFREAFLKELPEGKKSYLNALRRMLIYLYNESLKQRGGSYFVDKSTAYSLIVSELVDVFPKARFVVLRRNPLAVLVSILTRWTKGAWFTLAAARPDLLDAPFSLLEGLESGKDRMAIVHFEALVLQTEATIQSLCSDLNLPYSPDMLNPNPAALPRWEYGDQASVYRSNTPDPEYVERWISKLKHPQVWRFCSDYLDLLGDETLAQLGYDAPGLRRTLKEFEPPLHLRSTTFPLTWILNKPSEERDLWDRLAARAQRRYFNILIPLYKDIDKN